MILKYISIPELNLAKSWNKGLLKIKALNKFDRYMTIFWLLGPFIYLIERDPADLWLSMISIVFFNNHSISQLLKHAILNILVIVNLETQVRNVNINLGT